MILVAQTIRRLTLNPMLSGAIYLDLETDRDGRKIHQAGLYVASQPDGKAWRWKRPRPLPELKARLEDALSTATVLAGHNLWRHDLRVLKEQFPDLLRLTELPVVDTLELSPLCFPQNPYHSLHKSYKPTGREDNDPVVDAILAHKLLCDELQALKKLRKASPLLYSALHGLATLGEEPITRGYQYVFPGPPLPGRDLLTLVRALAAEGGCHSAASRIELPDLRENRMALAYLLAWLSVAGDGRSVLPGWVWNTFPLARELADRLRDTPCENTDCTWCRTQFNPLARLRQWFGFEQFRQDNGGGSLQQQIVEAAFANRSLLAILPTGGGKSLCYQLPALSRMERRGSLTIVISPLQSLMKDQVDQLGKRVPAAQAHVATINGLLTPLERADVLNRIRMGDIGLLYVAPEQLRNPSFIKAVQTREIGAWVFDEAHCLSKWGHDFRTDYLYAERFIRDRMGSPIPPILYVTATAKADVIEEIRAFHQRIHRDAPKPARLEIFESTVHRAELEFRVMPSAPGAERLAVIADLLDEHLTQYGQGGAIVFRSSRGQTQVTAEYLKKRGWRAEFFHAGLLPEKKKEVQDRFIAGDLNVIAATNAFGMGVDKEDVRLVIHGDMPGSLENYLQEAGRAGRDRNPAKCILLYDSDDADWQFQINAMNRLSRAEIRQILRTLRKFNRRHGDKLVISTGELLHDPWLRETFGGDADEMLNTKIKTAISWLERDQFVQRDDNVTRVFQAKPIAQTRNEAELIAHRLGESSERQRLWGDILHEFVTARMDAGVDVDRLTALNSFKSLHRLAPGSPSVSSLFFAELRAMSKANILRECTRFTAYLRHKIKDAVRQRFARFMALEKEILSLWCEQNIVPKEPVVLDMSVLVRRLKSEDYAVPQMEVPKLVQGLCALGEQGVRLLNIQPRGGTSYRVHLHVEMDELMHAATERRQHAATVLDTLINQIPPDAPAGADTQVEFTMEQLCNAFEGSLLYLPPPQPTRASEQILLWLHELGVIRLQRGLAFFRSAMTLQMVAEPTRQYGVKHYQHLHDHYDDKTFQVHVILEYARRGTAKIQAALQLVLDYFRLGKAAFIQQYLPNQKKVIERAVTAETYKHIVENLGDPEQRQIVEANEDQNLLVLAGPGSGKTKTIVHRVAWLVQVRHVPARAILALCFNHDAAIQLRRRLRDLIGSVAAAITVMTYHGLAMRLTGTTFRTMAEEAAQPDEPGAPVDFSEPIRRAISLLKGDAAPDPDEASNARDRILAGFRFILVDEYQDINELQYELVSALAGRTLQDPDAKINLLAVGDDDQNIYAFRGANIQFIRRFERDYAARTFGLTSNYRSSRRIIEAANRVIELNHDRMKKNIPLHLDRRRAEQSPGTPVRLVAAASRDDQTSALLQQVREWHASGIPWNEMAILAVQHNDLDAFRAAAEVHQIPLNIRLARDADADHASPLPALWRMREPTMLFDKLRALPDEPLSGQQAGKLIESIEAVCGTSPWSELLAQAVHDASTQHMMPHQWIEHLHEHLTLVRRDGRIGGNGIWLSTIHAAKGTEYDAVAIAGSWQTGGRRRTEEKRRLLYVGMTRARRHLTVVDRTDETSSLLAPLCASRDIVAAVHTRPPSAEWPRREYRLLGTTSMDLAAIGRFSERPFERASAIIRKLRVDDTLQWVDTPHGIWLKHGRTRIARLSKNASGEFRQWQNTIERIRVIGVYLWRKSDLGAEWRGRCNAEIWGVPLCEVILRPSSKVTIL